jgi:hypothetical protein
MARKAEVRTREALVEAIGMMFSVVGLRTLAVSLSTVRMPYQFYRYGERCRLLLLFTINRMI